MLQMLVAFLPEIRNKVEEQLVGEAPEGLLDLIHKLHGSCGYSGVPRLKNSVSLLSISYAAVCLLRNWNRSFWNCLMNGQRHPRRP
jgi:HPt (histidine-containing phosphotransfer) domain-containing protein